MQSADTDATTAPSVRRLLLARVLAGITLVSFTIGLVFAFLDASIRPPGTGDPLGDIVFVLSFAMFPVIGYMLAIRRPENSIGWLMLGIGTFFGLAAIVSELGGYLVHSGRRDAGFVLIAFDQPSWVPIVVLPITFLLLLFPDGHLPSPRWRRFAWSLGIALTLVFFSILLDPAPMQESPVPDVPNPIGIEALRPILNAAQALILTLQEHVHDLEARLGQTSANSSRPPSSDPPHTPARPKAPLSGCKRGGQPGHRGTCRALLLAE